MEKYQQLEQKVQELQKEIYRLKKEEQQQNKLPKDFNRDIALSFLDSPNSRYFEYIFSWNETPQGFSYWNNIYTNLENPNYKVPDEVIIQIQKWVTESYKNNQ